MALCQKMKFGFLLLFLSFFFKCNLATGNLSQRSRDATNPPSTYVFKSRNFPASILQSSAPSQPPKQVISPGWVLIPVSNCYHLAKLSLIPNMTWKETQRSNCHTSPLLLMRNCSFNNVLLCRTSMTIAQLQLFVLLSRALA